MIKKYVFIKIIKRCGNKKIEFKMKKVNFSLFKKFTYKINT